jgi:hypothetical protein
MIHPRYREMRARDAGLPVDNTKTNPRARRLPRAEDVDLYVWEERDRLHIEARNRKTEKTIAEWWDDDARQMFEDGFFDSRRLEHSVVKYLQDVGLVQAGPF